MASASFSVESFNCNVTKIWILPIVNQKVMAEIKPLDYYRTLKHD